TAKGYGFRTTPDLSETTRAGRRVARVGEGDEIVSIEPVTGTTVVVATRRGKMLRFALDEVAELSGPGRGVILMRPGKEDDDRIVGAVTLPKDGASATVADNGRGIPVDRHAQYKKPALELILTTLHAGGKFEAKNYYHSGGLHGVGASVVTALAEKLVARVRRDGAEWE